MKTKTRFRSPSMRVKALKLAEKLGSVAEAARQLGVHRSTLHEWKRRKAEHGIAGLTPLPPIHAKHPQTTPDDMVRMIKELALAHPSYGCYRLWELLPSNTQRVSTTTVQNILKRNGLGTKKDRWLALEDFARAHPNELSEEQTEFLEAMNPCFPNCNVKNQGPGWALVAGSWKVRVPDAREELLFFSILDVWSGYAFGAVVSAEQMRVALQQMDEKISRFYSRRGCRAKAIYVSNDMKNEDNATLSYEYIYFEYTMPLAPTVIRKDRASCCLKRFQRIATQEYFNKLLPDALNSGASDLDEVFQKWLQRYNAEQKQEGYPHNGRAPLDRFNMQARYRPKKESPKKPCQSPGDGSRLGAFGSGDSYAQENSSHSKRKRGSLADLYFGNQLPQTENLPIDFGPEPNVLFWRRDAALRRLSKP